MDKDEIDQCIRMYEIDITSIKKDTARQIGMQILAALFSHYGATRADILAVLPDTSLDRPAHN